MLILYERMDCTRGVVIASVTGHFICKKKSIMTLNFYSRSSPESGDVHSCEFNIN